MKNLNDILVELLLEEGHDEMDIGAYESHWSFNRQEPMAKDIVIRITAYPKDKKIKTLKEVYAKIYREHKSKYMTGSEPYPITQDKANRLATRWAVKNTPKEWRKQYDTTNC